MNSNTQESPNLKRYNSAPQINKLEANNKPQMSLPREPTSFSNIFTPRARRFSASFSPSPLASPNFRKISTSQPSPRQSDRNGDRINQLKMAECGEDLREINHEREVHNQIQMSASYEDLTLVAESWSFKNNFDDISNPMNSPSNRSTSLRFPYHHMSPSPTRKTFATRRSMSPCSMRPSTLSGVKRKFELDEATHSPPPFKRIFSDSRGPPSPSICPSPSPSDSSHEGGYRPKLFAAKIFSNANTNSLSSLSSSGNESETTCLLMDNTLPIASMDRIVPMEEVPEEIINLDTKNLSTSLVQEQSVDKMSVNLPDNDKMLLEKA